MLRSLFSFRPRPVRSAPLLLVAAVLLPGCGDAEEDGDVTQLVAEPAVPDTPPEPEEDPDLIAEIPEKPPVEPATPETLTAFLGGPAARAAIAEPTEVRAVRMLFIADEPTGGELDESQIPPAPPQFDQLLPDAGPAPVPSAEAAALSAALTEKVWLTPGPDSLCLPMYDVRFLFAGADGAVADVWVCFECDLISVAVDGETHGVDDSDALRPVLLAAARAAFPDDPELTSLD